MNGRTNRGKLGKAGSFSLFSIAHFLVQAAADTFGFTDIFFVDGGGDSLILRESDASRNGEPAKPFQGGDADLLDAIHSTPIKANIYQGIIGN